MKTTIALAAAILLGVTATYAEKVEITFTYAKQAGPGSNQFAIYIENPEGDIVKTLYVTRFTAEGGYAYRTSSLPLWVGKSNIQGMEAAAIDAITGPTPQEGILTYLWDLTGLDGNRVKDGTYYFIVEATFWSDNQVLFRKEISIGNDPVRVNATPQFNSDEEKNRCMITSVYAEYIP